MSKVAIFPTRVETTPGGAVLVTRILASQQCPDGRVWTVEQLSHGGRSIIKRIVCQLPDSQRVFEAEYPSWADCPVSFFDAAPIVACAAWRDCVRELAGLTGDRMTRAVDRLIAEAILEDVPGFKIATPNGGQKPARGLRRTERR